jgi:hypothetical protein
LYHSEAALLPDGKVLVSGSDPESVEFNEEFRIEVRVFSVPFRAVVIAMLEIGVRPSVPEPRLQATHLHAERNRLDLRRPVYHHKCGVIPGHD